MLKIRLQRIGRRNNPSYRIVAVDSRMAAKKGKPVELLGTYDTIRKNTSINKDRVIYWISQGAQVSDTVHNILVTKNITEGKKRNALPKKRPTRNESEEGAEEKSQKPEQSSEQQSETVNEQAPEASAETEPTPQKNPSEEG